MSPTSESVTVAGRDYRDHPWWLRYQEFFPGGLRVSRADAPRERWWPWRGMAVHLDRVVEPEAPAKVLALHGPASYGRMLAPYGRLPAVAGLEFLAPDLPDCGLTDTGGRTADYGMWVECVLDLINAERSVDPRPVVLLGTSLGGRLAYDVAARAPEAIAGVVVTCLPDPRRVEVRRYLAARPELGMLASLMPLLPHPLRPLRVPTSWLANVAAMSNHAQFAALVCGDPLGGGGRTSLELVRTCLGSAPEREPEEFTGPPLLVAHPAEDRWTPAALSRRFLDRVRAPTRYVSLTDAGHLPVEEAGLADLDRALRDFLDELELR
ncbi:alpha-beta hydrolase superfamily lysophospholipase [Saccharopolyspora lacisalsi]|uniref:Alpha-beta hydrolase superfamily lysophospholipase n=1 Tax=Halosaccharopolyspora lacisalsi TaxID=1000566 RepID=A0A839E1A6_9PSEU|nr:alpha/beta fold hydrolase [Halosaccharopolyspora lacisalsi]MBA8827063.1 alpha-beta hydrolase superfamily lysophospholipase [Halosaccharopolyspora lacisalsi]